MPFGIRHLSEQQNTRKWWAFRYSLLVAISTLLAGHWGVFDILESNVATPVSFKLRSDLNRNPTLDPRIEIIAFDDTTINELGRPFPTFEEWELVLGHIARQNPQSIVIDQVFQIVEQNKDLEKLVARQPELPPIYAGVFSSPGPIVGRNPAKSRFHADPNIDNIVSVRQHEHIYGPAKAIEGLFSGLGSINYLGQGQLAAAQVGPQGDLFSSLGLTIASAFEVRNSQVLADSQAIPVTRHGTIQVNQSGIMSYFKRAQNFASVLRAARTGQALKRIGPETHVFILPLMYTGSADFKATPLGEVPGGLLHVSVANSFLTGQWISSVGHPLIVSMLFAAFALLIAHFFAPFAAFIVVSATAIITVGAGLSAFIYESVMIPWSEPTLTLLLTGLSAIAEKSRVLERRSLQVKHTLAGLVSPKLLRTLLRSPRSTLENARRQCMTVMFIDIEGFSVKSQERDPNVVFTRLKAELNQLCRIVQLYGGIVDKTLGDGLLAYFGHNLDGSEKISNREHAVTAICCAIDIQVNSARRILGEMNDRSPETEMDMMQFPLRIGINTGDVYAGNVGNDERIDLTVVGNAVNWAKRYEDACESFRVMIGPRTAQIISGEDMPDSFEVRVGDTTYALKHRDLIVKHYEQRWSGWECNPFQHSPRQLVAALDAVSRASNQAPSQTIARGAVTMLAFGEVTLEVFGFCENAIQVLSRRYLSKRDSFEIVFDASFLARLQDRDSLAKPSRALTLFPSFIRATVLWGIQEGEVSRHGLKIVDVTSEQRQVLMDCLQEYAEVNRTGQPVAVLEHLPDSA